MPAKRIKTPVTLPGLLLYPVFFVLMVAVGAAGAFGWSKKDVLVELWYTANEQRYLVMSGGVGPVTYLVYHDDYSLLEEAAYTHDDILGVEMYKFPETAAMAFTGADAASIEMIANFPSVRKTVRKRVPMICH
jgi:hypothetical protein